MDLSTSSMENLLRSLVIAHSLLILKQEQEQESGWKKLNFEL
jgi:hypothetical protein